MHDSWSVSQIKIELPIKNRKILLAFASSDNQNVGDFVGDMSETKLTERQQKILNLIKESPTISAKQMSETLSVTSRTIERDLSLMKKAGVLKREGKDNNGVWHIIETLK